MASATKANIIKIKKKVTAYSIGPTGASMRVVGRMASSMEKELIFLAVEQFEWACGMRESGQLGSKIQSTKIQLVLWNRID